MVERKIPINKWIVFVISFFIIISPFENVVRIEKYTYVIGILLLMLPMLYSVKFRIQNIFELIFLLCYVCVSAFWSPQEGAVGGLLTVIATFLFLFLQLGYVYSEQDVNQIKWAIVIQGFVLLMTCYRFGYYMDGRLWIKTDQSSADPNYLVGWFLIPIACCLEQIFKVKSKWIKFFLSLEVFACFFCIFQTASRAGLITSAFLVIICLIYLSMDVILRHPIKAIIILVLLGVVLMIGYRMLPSMSLLRITGTVGLGNRGIVWGQLLEQLKKNPVGLFFGFGHLSTSNYNYENYVAHNTFLETLFNYGIIGLTLLLVYLIRTFCRKIKEDPFLAFALFTVCIHVCTLTALTTRFFMLALFLGGIIMEPDAPKVNEKDKMGQER